MPRLEVIIAGAGSLQGRELDQVLRQHRFSAGVRLLDDAGSTPESALEESAEGLEPISETALAGAAAVFFAGPTAQTRRWYEAARHGGARIFDLSGELLDEPGAECLTPEQWSSRPLAADTGRLWVIPHPVAALLASLLSRIGGLTAIDAAAAMLLQPASEFGQPGMEELQAQTRNILNFQPLPTEVFGAQSAFNVHAGLPVEIQPGLAETAASIGRHLERLLANEPDLAATRPGLQVLQAPWFYGHGLSVYVQTRVQLDTGALSRALHAQETAPDMLAAGSAEDALIGPVRPDTLQPNGCWIFCALDRLRLAAQSAAKLAEMALAEQVQ